MPKNSKKRDLLQQDEAMMRRVLELASKGKGFVNPNPLVGALILQEGEIIGEGYHEKFGEAHAEINAINNCQKEIKAATLYVNLEPCSHQGKTPSCAKEIIKHDFKRVVIANQDPNPLVAGKGVEILKQNGIEVVLGVLEPEAAKLNQIFFKYIQTKQPFVMIKTAMSLDGKIATHGGDSKWISSSESRAYVHELRHQYSAIMTGLNTIIKDDPTLNTRNNLANPSHPIRIVLDPEGKIPLNSKILNTPEYWKPIIVVSDKVDKDLNFIKSKAEVITCPMIDEHFDLKALFAILGEKGIDSVMVEAGGYTNFEMIKQRVVEKLLVFMAPKIIGGKEALSPFSGEGFENIADAKLFSKIEYNKIGNDLLIEAEI